MADQELSFQHDAVARSLRSLQTRDTKRILPLTAVEVCFTCAAAAAAQLKESPSASTKATLYGILAVVPGLAIYAFISIATRWHIGYLAIGIAWFVAFAMKKGSEEAASIRLWRRS